MDTDKVWKRFGNIDPYYGVYSSDDFKSGKLTEEAHKRFIRSGEDHVRKVLAALHQIDQEFVPGRVLDFGCGVGRVAIPLARASHAVLGVDVAPGMLAEAQLNANKYGVSNLTFSQVIEGQFDLVHSSIVLQHIPPSKGMKIVRDLAGRVDQGGMLALHMPYGREATAWRRIATVVKRRLPVVNGVLNLISGRPFRYPTMTMFCYDLSAVMSIIQRAGLVDVRLTLDEPSWQSPGYSCAMLYARRRQATAL